MKIQFSSKNMTVPDRVYSHAEQRINELESLFREHPKPPWCLVQRMASMSLS